MGRLVLIEFDNDDQAVKLVKQINQGNRNGKPFRVVGYFATPPGPYCHCPIESWTHERGKPYAASKFSRKTGWTKCLECQLYRDFNTHLVNQLKPEKLINPRANDYVTGKSSGKTFNFFSSIGSSSRRLSNKEAQ